jgi:ACS family tartrate transporter-like MFS transporter
VAAGASTLATGWWGTLTFGAGALALLWASRQQGFRALPYLFLTGAAGFAGAGLAHNVPAAVASFCVAAMGLLSSLPMFWSMAASRLSGKAAGTAIAIVNSFGAVGAFAGPYAMGWLHDATHSYSAGLWAIAICMGLGAFLVLGAGARPKPGSEESSLPSSARA